MDFIQKIHALMNKITGKSDASDSSPTASSDPRLDSQVRALAKNEIILSTQKKRTALSPNATKIGGEPYLPADFVWPTYTSPDDGITRPLSFLCQINLKEVQPYDAEGLLPTHGMLYFFYEFESFRWGYDPEDRGAAQVFYIDTADALELAPHKIPDAIVEDYVIPEMPLKLHKRPSYPAYEELELHTDLPCEWEQYDASTERLGYTFDDDPDYHKLLGYANVIQNEMLTECERVARGLYSGDAESYSDTPSDTEQDIASHANEWTLLLQLSTLQAGDFELMFGDCGMLYFYIKKQDLSEMRVDRIHFSLQCG